MLVTLVLFRPTRKPFPKWGVSLAMLDYRSKLKVNIILLWLDEQVCSQVRSNGDVKVDASCRESAKISAKLRTLATSHWEVRKWSLAKHNFRPYPIYPHFKVAVKISPFIISNGIFCRLLDLHAVFIVNMLSSWAQLIFATER